VSRPWLVLLLCAPLLGCGGSGDSDDGETLVFAAASLADVLVEIERAHATAGGGAVRFNFAGSNELSRQILAGAPAELLIAADRAQVDRLVEAGLLIEGDVTELLANELVVIGAPGRPPLHGPSELLAVERLALADPRAVPGGIYARQWLENRGLWRELEARVVPALDVRAALQAVAAGDVEAGIVYATDVSAPGASGRVGVLWRVGPDDPAAPRIRYYSCRLGDRSAGARRFDGFLRTAPAAAILTRAGFRPLATEPPP
jgi:molybdate transport system substrate-binding protein